MQEFQGNALPDRPSGIVDGKQTLSGHGYQYTARPLLNLVVGRKERRVLIVPDDVLGSNPDFNDKEYTTNVLVNIGRGFTDYTVGEIYNFGDNNDRENQVLARVTEAIVCMDGVSGLRIPSLKAMLQARLAIGKGPFSPATNPATS